MPSALSIVRLMTEFKLGRLHDWQFGGVFALENPAGIDAGQAVRTC